jgi:hypothetical protein
MRKLNVCEMAMVSGGRGLDAGMQYNLLVFMKDAFSRGYSLEKFFNKVLPELVTESEMTAALRAFVIRHWGDC